MLIFCSCIGLDWGNCQELEAAYATNNENNLIEKADLGDLKAAAKQLKREKQKQKRMEEQAKKRQDVVLNENPDEDQDEVHASPLALGPASFFAFGPASISAPGPTLSPLISPSTSRSGPASSLLVSLSVSCSGPASSLSVSPSASRFGLASSMLIFLSASRSGPILPLLFSFPTFRFGPASISSHSRSLSFVNPTFTGRAFSPVVSRNSLVCQQFASQAKRCSSLPRDNKDEVVSLIKIPKKRLQEEVDKTNQKRFRF